MTDAGRPSEVDQGSWAGARRAHLRSALNATPAQRLDWLEAVLKLAHASGAVARRRDAHLTATSDLADSREEPDPSRLDDEPDERSTGAHRT